MRAFAWFLLLFGPVLSLPAAAGLWAHAHLQSDDYALAAVAGTLFVEAMALAKPGLVRDVAVFLLACFWVVCGWLALTQSGYDWSDLPEWRMPNGIGQMAIILAVLAYLMFYEIAKTTPVSGRQSTR